MVKCKLKINKFCIIIMVDSHSVSFHYNDANGNSVHAFADSFNLMLQHLQH